MPSVNQPAPNHEHLTKSNVLSVLYRELVSLESAEDQLNCLGSVALNSAPVSLVSGVCPGLATMHGSHWSSSRETSSLQSISGYYWNTNIPEEEWTLTCPEFLRDQPPRNVAMLGSKNEDAQLESWSDVQSIVCRNDIDLFRRTPVELRRYLQFCYSIKQEYGSVLAFIQEKRLLWKTITSSGHAPFTNPTDYKILLNDWPYAIEPDVSHLVVWTKFHIEEDAATGDLTETSKDIVEGFVRQTFCDEKSGGVVRERVVWFKNPKRLKSVHALEHFHVMLFKASEEFLAMVTQGDRAISKMLG